MKRRQKTESRTYRFGIFIYFMLGLSCPGMADDRLWEVGQFIEISSKNKTVMIPGGRSSGLSTGLILLSYRPARIDNGVGLDEIVVETGRLKVISVKRSYALATVTDESSPLSKALFPKFPGIMTGDLLRRKVVSMSRVKKVIPTTQIPYGSIYVDPKSNPSSFELSNRGLEILAEKAAVYAQARLSLLMIEGYTDHNGSAVENQIESYQRALTVRQYLIDHLGFDPDRVVAIGYGERESADQSMVSGYRANNRRIILKAVPISSD